MFESMKSDFINTNKLKSRLRRYWGTTMKYDPDLGYDVEVLKKKMIIYPGTHSKPVRMIANTFGMWHDIKDEEFKDVDKYWLYLNYKRDRNRTDEDKDIFVNKLNLNLNLDEPFEIRMGVRDPADPKKFNGMTKQELLDYAVYNMGSEGLTKVNMAVESDTITRVAIGHYAFVEGAEDFFDVEVVEAVVTPVYVPAVSKKEARAKKDIPAYYTSSIGIRVKITQKANVQSESDFADNLYNDKDEYRLKYRDAVIISPTDVPIDENFDLDAVFLENDEYSNKTNEKWLDGQLRMSVFNSYVYNRNDFKDLIARTVDSDFKPEDQGGGIFSGFLGAIVAIIIIVLAVMTGGLAAALIVLNAGQIVLSMGGADSQIMNIYGKVVQVVNIISIVTGMYAAFKAISANITAAINSNIAAGMSTATATANAVFSTAKEAILGSVTTSAVGTSAMAQGATAAGATLTPAAQAAASVGQITQPVATVSWNKVISIGMKVISKILDTVEKAKIRDMSSEITKLQDQVARTREQIEDDARGNPNLAIDYIQWSTDNLKSDGHQFQVDYLYEGTWNNICRPSFMATGLNIRDKEYEFTKGRERDSIGQQQSFV